MSPDDLTESKKAAETVITLPVFTAEDDADPSHLLLEAAHILANNPGPEDRAIASEVVALARTPLQSPQVRAGELAEASGVSSRARSTLIGWPVTMAQTSGLPGSSARWHGSCQPSSRA